MTKVSCLMVTQESRSELVAGAVESFCRQTHEPRELVIVHCGSPRYTERLRALVVGQDATLVSVPETATLGAARNLSIKHAAGDVLCQWDDDDIYHPDRSRDQLAAMQSSGADAAYLNEQYYLFRAAGELYVRRADKIHGTAMFRNGVDCRYPEEGPRASKGEDSAFLEYLHRKYQVVGISGSPELYLRVFHGGNTWQLAHHRNQVRDVETAAVLRARRKQIEYDAKRFNVSGVTMMGRDGPAFAIE